MPPEQLSGGAASVDHRADVYAVGAVLYELLTGTLPLGRFPPPSATRGVPSALDAIVLRSLERDPPARYPSAAALRADLEAAREALYPRAAGAFRGAGERARELGSALWERASGAGWLDRWRVSLLAPGANRLLVQVAVVAALVTAMSVLPWFRYRSGTSWSYSTFYRSPWGSDLEGLPNALIPLAVMLSGALALRLRHRRAGGLLRALRWTSGLALAHAIAAGFDAGALRDVGLPAFAGMSFIVVTAFRLQKPTSAAMAPEGTTDTKLPTSEEAATLRARAREST
jgi:hypothetical protein